MTRDEGDAGDANARATAEGLSSCRNFRSGGCHGEHRGRTQSARFRRRGACVFCCGNCRHRCPPLHYSRRSQSGRPGVGTGQCEHSAPGHRCGCDCLFAREGALWFLFLGLQTGYRWLRNREGLGSGDVKLAGVAGAWLGWSTIPIAIEVAALAALGGYAAHRWVTGWHFGQQADCRSDSFLHPQSGLAGSWKHYGPRRDRKKW